MEVPSEIVAADLLRAYGDVAELAARAGGDVLRDWRGRFAVSTKGPKAVSYTHLTLPTKRIV